MEKRKIPAVRFKGFEDDWEQRKLGKLSSSFEYGLNAAAKEYDGENKYIRITDIDDDSREFKQADITSPDTDLSSAENYKLSEGDILFARTGASVGKTYIYKASDGLVYYAGFLIRAKIKPEYNSKFVFQNTLTGNYEKFIKVTSMRSGQPGVNAQEYSQYQIMMPSKLEQDKISDCLRNLDNFITLHQRKLEKLQLVKKSMLEKMFPKNGSKIPEIRFEGFGDDWEQRKVGDYYEFKNGLNKGKEFFGEGTPIVNFTDVFHNRGISPEMLSGKVRLELSEIKNYEVKKGDIFFTRTSETIEEIGYPSVMLGEPENTVFSGFVLRGRCFLKDDPLDNLFKKYIFFTDAFRTEMLRKSSMTTRALTSGTAIKNMEFLHPSSKEEQHKNGELLTNLDHLITLHQRKLEKLKSFKKSLLEKLFVQ